MKNSLAVLLVLSVPVQAAPGYEALKVSADKEFLSASAAVPPASLIIPTPPAAEPFQEAPPEMHFFQEPVLQDPKLKALEPSPLGGVVGRVTLSAQLDKHRDLMTRQLGRTVWNISVAGDPGFKNFFLTFQAGERLLIRPLGDLNRLRGEGINVEIEPGVTYNFKVSVNIFNPVRGSTLKMTPVNGTQGPSHGPKTGEILDAIKARSYVFKSGGTEYWTLFGTDVDPATNALAQTKSLLFINEAGLSSKAWPLAESALSPDKPHAVTLKQDLVLTKTSQGELLIQTP